MPGWTAKLARTEELGVAAALVALVVLFASVSREFLSLETWSTVLSFVSVLGVIGLGACLLMIAGEFDLSVGSVAALCGMVFAAGVTRWGGSTYVWGLIGVLLGAGLGWINAQVTLKTQIPSFITTLGAMLIWRGVVLGASGGFPISLASEREGLLKWLGGSFAGGEGGGFSYAVVWWLALAAALAWVLKLTPLGNHILATGGNLAASRSQGIATARIKTLCFTLSGGLAGFAGLMLFSQLKDLSPTAGENYELYAIAGTVIGGTALTGGSGTIIGTVLGTLLIGVVQAGLVHVGIDSYWFRTFVGVLLVLSVILNHWLKRRLTLGTRVGATV